MQIKKIYMAVIFVLLLGIGIYTGNSIYRYYTHCLQINYEKATFYGQFATELKSAMQKIGYSFTCPAYVPKTTLDFTYTGNKTNHRGKLKKIDINIALVGDCYDAFDIELLKTYDYILPVYEYHLGYLAMFNFKAIHFPIKYIPFNKWCNTSYKEQEIDIEDVAEQLDNIIRRAR